MVINLSRDEFIDYMKVLENHYWRTKHLADVFGVDDLCGLTELMDLSVAMLAEPFQDVLVEDADTGEMDLLTYFCWTMEFGERSQKVQVDGQIYDVATAGDIYELLAHAEERSLIRRIKEIYTTTDYGCEPTDTMKQSGCYMD